MGERRTFDTNLVMSGETEAFSGCGCAFAHCSWWATVTLGEERSFGVCLPAFYTLRLIFTADHDTPLGSQARGRLSRQISYWVLAWACELRLRETRDE